MAGSATFAVTAVTPDLSVKELTINWTGDATAGTVPSYSSDDVTVAWGGGTQTLTSLLKGAYGLVAITQPGTPAPTSYSVTMNDAYGVDFLDGKLMSLSTSLSARANIQTNDPVSTALTFALTGNTTPSAIGTIVIKLLYAGTARWRLQ